MNYGWMIVLVIILVVCIVLVTAFFTIKEKLRQLSSLLWGTDSIAEGAAQMRNEYASTPKSVAAMTSLLLPRITEDFPDFSYPEMKDRAENVLISYLSAISRKDVSIIRDATQELKDQAANHIQMLEEVGKRERFQKMNIHRIEISQYRKEAGRCIITFQASLECLHTIEDKRGKVLEGSKELKYQTRFNVDLVYIQDRAKIEDERDHALGVNCPNCGAPLSSLGAKFCEYCGTPVIEINIHAWSFVNVEEV